MDYKVLAEVNKNNQMIVPINFEMPNGYIEMNSKRPKNGYYIAGSNGDWIHYTAQEEQAWVQSELEYCDMQRKYSFDTKRFEFDSIDHLNDYVISLRDYVTCDRDTGELTIHGERPVK